MYEVELFVNFLKAVLHHLLLSSFSQTEAFIEFSWLSIEQVGGLPLLADEEKLGEEEVVEATSKDNCFHANDDARKKKGDLFQSSYVSKHFPKRVN